MSYMYTYYSVAILALRQVSQAGLSSRSLKMDSRQLEEVQRQEQQHIRILDMVNRQRHERQEVQQQMQQLQQQMQTIERRIAMVEREQLIQRNVQETLWGYIARMWAWMTGAPVPPAAPPADVD